MMSAMAITCPRCGAEFDATLFEFEHRVRCACGAEIRYPGRDLRSGHVATDPTRRRKRENHGATEPLLRIDGSFGEGGGQILRSSLALSLVTGKPFVIANIRASRKKPGLMRQHLSAVRAAAEISQAQVEGAALDSKRLTFCPGTIKAGDYTFDVGSAGSATLVLQTVLPALLAGRRRVPPDPARRNAQSVGPALRFPGQELSAAGESAGADGRGPPGSARLLPDLGRGEFTVRIQPARQLGRLELTRARRELRAHRVRVLLANLPRHIAERECRTIAQQTGWSDDCFHDCRAEGRPRTGQRGDDRAGGRERYRGLHQLWADRREGRGRSPGRRSARPTSIWPPACRWGRHLADQIMLPLGVGAYCGTGGGAISHAAASPPTPRRTWKSGGTFWASTRGSSTTVGATVWCKLARSGAGPPTLGSYRIQHLLDRLFQQGPPAEVHPQSLEFLRFDLIFRRGRGAVDLAAAAG
jgi:RNA 3'-terminal phosphate cyclase (ATP)